MMRISTLMQYRSGEQNIVNRQRELLLSQAQVASGRRISSPQDDPLGAADASAFRTSLARLAQFKDNQGHAQFLLNQGEAAVAQVADALADIQEKLVAAGNGAYGDDERRAIAGELRGLFNRLAGLANSSDGAGGYLFAGSRESGAPFSQNGVAVSFNGDEVLQRLEVANDRLMQVKFSGDELFLKLRPGNGTFVTTAASGNAGSASIDAGTVLDPAALTGSAYRIDFDGSNFVVTRALDGVTRSFAPASGGMTAIALDGLQVTLSGTPSAGDRFDIAPAGYQSMFDTVAQAIAVLETPVGTSVAARAQFQSRLMQAQASLSLAHDHLLLKRAAIGTGLAELEAYQSLNEDRTHEFQGRLSDVEDLDYPKAISELTRRQTSFEAAIRSYSTVSKLSLFNYL